MNKFDFIHAVKTNEENANMRVGWSLDAPNVTSPVSLAARRPRGSRGACGSITQSSSLTKAATQQLLDAVTAAPEGKSMPHTTAVERFSPLSAYLEATSGIRSAGLPAKQSPFYDPRRPTSPSFSFDTTAAPTVRRLKAAEAEQGAVLHPQPMRCARFLSHSRSARAARIMHKLVSL